jgi:hypothetical protein
MIFLSDFAYCRMERNTPLNRLRSIFVVLIACLTWLPGIRIQAQIVNIESQRIQTDSIRFVLHGDLRYKLLRNNNSRFNSFSAANTTQFKNKSLKNIFLFIASADFSFLGSEAISNSMLFHGRYNRKINPWLRFELFTQAQYNRVLNIRLRQLNGIGPRFKIFGTDYFKIYLGTLYMLENQQFFGANEILTTRHRLSSYLSVLYHFPAGHGEFSSVTYYQPRFDDFSDFRLSNQTSLNLKITSKLAMTNTLNLYYESRPADNIANFNYLFENGLRLTL